MVIVKQKKETVPAFGSILDTIKEIADYNYQLHQWIARENPKDYGCYENAIMYFLEDGEAVFDAWNAGRIEMTDTQYHMLKTLYDMVDVYDRSDKRPDTDKDIVNDPEWHRIRNYAKLAYEELAKK